MVPWSSRATAFLALTGDTDFNIFLRARARRMGLVLNEYGLWKWEPSLSKSSGDVDAPQEPSAPPVLFPEHKERIKVKTGRPSKAGEGAEGDHTPGLGEGVEDGKWEKIETPTEQDVMSELGLGWVEPARRNYGLLAYKKK
jgi:DNA polymerase beta